MNLDFLDSYHSNLFNYYCNKLDSLNHDEYWLLYYLDCLYRKDLYKKRYKPISDNNKNKQRYWYENYGYKNWFFDPSYMSDEDVWMYQLLIREKRLAGLRSWRSKNKKKVKQYKKKYSNEIQSIECKKREREQRLRWSRSDRGKRLKKEHGKLYAKKRNERLKWRRVNDKEFRERIRERKIKNYYKEKYGEFWLVAKKNHELRKELRNGKESE